LILGKLDDLRVDAIDSTTLKTPGAILSYIRMISSLKSLKKAMKDGEKSYREVFHDSFDDVLSSTECHSISFDSGAPKSDPAELFKSVGKFVVKLSQQAYIGKKPVSCLSSDIIHDNVNDVVGKVTGYITRKSPLPRLFFENFDLAEGEATILYYNEDPQKRLTSGSFTIDPVHSSIVQVADGKSTTHIYIYIWMII
jgi:hypothetical protein